MPEPQQAELLAKSFRHGCVGVAAFPMGVTTNGRAKGYAYWSVRCKNGKSYAVQIAPNPRGTAVVVDRKALEGTGRECLRNSENRIRPLHQSIDWRHTEYHRPRFLSFHCGSAQFLRTISANSVALAGATGVESEQATRNIAKQDQNTQFHQRLSLHRRPDRNHGRSLLG